MKKLLIDSNYICHRAWHVLGGLEYEEYPTGVIFGFLNEILSLSIKFKTNKFIFCWDSKNNLRKKIDKNYKQNRNKLSLEKRKEVEPLYKQITLTRKKILPAIGFKNNYISNGLEADDLLAHIVQNIPYNEYIIISADNDLFQLLPYCDMYSLNTKILYTEKVFEKMYKYDSKDWWKIKALAGCSSDNVIGVPGVGEKTAIKYFKKELNPKTKTYKKIKNQWNSTFAKNYKLVKLPLKKINLPYLTTDDFNLDNFLTLCNKLDFQSFLNKEKLDKWKYFFKLQETNTE